MVPVVFDLDGTLIDSLPDVTKAVNLLLAEVGLPLVDQTFVNTLVGSGERVLMQRLIAGTDLEASAFESLLTKLIAHYKVAARDTKMFPGARAALDGRRQGETPEV